LKIAIILLSFERENGPVTNQMVAVIRGNYIIILLKPIH